MTTSDQALTQDDVPFNTPEKIEKRNKLFAGVGNPQKRLPEYLKFGEQLKSEGFAVLISSYWSRPRITYLSFRQVGSLGFCWGGKITFLAGASDVYAAVAGVHPSFVPLRFISTPK